MPTSNDDVFSNQIAKATNGDRDALRNLLLDVHHDLGKVVAYKLSGPSANQLNEEDVLQDVFIRAIEEVGKLQATDRAGFLAWLKKIASNQIVDMARKKASSKRGGDRVRVDGKQNAFEDRAFDLISQMSETDGSTPSQFAARREAIEAMNIAIANLSDEQREAVRLHFFDRLTLKETAEKMDRSWDSVRGLVQRAKQAIKESMHKSSLWLSRKG